MLQKGEAVLGLRWVKVRGEAKIVVTRWRNGRRAMSYEDLPFRPYCFIRETDAKKLDTETVFDARLEETKLKTIFGEYVVQVSVPIPQDIKQLRVSNPNIRFYEGDVPYGKRVFVDLDLNLPEEYVPAYCDIETDPRNMTSKTMQEYDKRLLSAAIVNEAGDRKFYCEDNELDLFEQLENELANYTCMVSWSDFDFVYLQGRAKALEMRLPYISSTEGIDLMYYFAQLVAKKTTNSYIKLIKAIEKMQELGAHVDSLPDIEVKDDYTLVYKYFVEAREKLKTYNLADSVSMQQIDAALHLSHSMYELMRKFKIWPTEFRQHSKIDDMIKLRLAHARGVVLPNRPEQHYDSNDFRKQKADKKGAHVFEPVAGYHENIAVLDFAGMYPAIMRSQNIGLDSLVDCESAEAKFRAPNGKCYREADCINTEYLKLVQTVFEEYDAELHAAQPETLAYYVAQAKRLKTKLIKNADFGITGYKTGRMYNAGVFESITTTGQALIKFASDYMKSRYNIPTIYGDTDSIFVKLPGALDNEKFTKSTNALNLAIQEYSKAHFGAAIDTEIELDYFADRAYFTSAKKRYVMHVANQDGKATDYILIRGFETQRRDWVDLSKRVQKMLFDELLTGKDAKTLEKEKRKHFLQLRQDLFDGKLDNEIVLTKGIRQELKDYATSLPHTRAAKILQDLGMYQTGSDVEYFVISHEKRTTIKTDEKGNLVIGKKGKPLKSTKLFIDVYPNVPNRPPIQRSGYLWLWQAQIMSILERVGMYVGDESMQIDPAQTTLFMRLPWFKHIANWAGYANLHLYAIMHLQNQHGFAKSYRESDR